MNVEAAIVLFLLGWRRPEQKPITIDLTFPRDRIGQHALRVLEGHGEIVQMLNYTGKSVTVLYRPSPDRPRQWELALPDDVDFRVRR